VTRARDGEVTKSHGRVARAALALVAIFATSACTAILGIESLAFTDAGTSAGPDGAPDVVGKDSAVHMDGKVTHADAHHDAGRDAASHDDARTDVTSTHDAGTSDAATAQDASHDAPPILLVQTVAPGYNATVTQNVTFQESAGNTLVAGVYSACSATTVTVSDSLGNPWMSTPEAYADLGNNNSIDVQLFYASNIKGGTNTVTVTPSNCTNYASLGAFVLEYSGVANASPLDGESRQVAPAASNAMSTPSITTTGALDQVIALFADYNQNDPMVAGTGFVRADDDGFVALIEDIAAGTAPATVTPAATLGAGDSDADWAGAAIALKGGGASIALVQALNTGSNEFKTVTQTAMVTENAGDALVAAVYSQCDSTTTVTDTLGNVWMSTPEVWNGGSDTGAQFFYALDVKSGANIVSATATACSNADLGFFMLEYSGIASANGIDGTAGQAAPAASNAMLAGSIQTTGARDQVLGLFVEPEGTGQMTAGSGFTAAASDTTWYAMVEDIAGGTPPANVSVTAALAGSQSDNAWVAAAIALKAE